MLKITPIDSPNFINYPIGNLNIVLYYDPNSQRKLVNAFSEKVSKVMVTVGINDYDESFPHNIYVLLKDVLLANATNINFEMIKNSFDPIDPFINELVFGLTNNFCLACITAYDLSKNTNFLKLAIYILEKYNFELLKLSMNYATIWVNLFQTRFRLYGDLTNKEHKELINLKNSCLRSNTELQFCVNVLLKNKIEADLYLNQWIQNRNQAMKGILFILFTRAYFPIRHILISMKTVYFLWSQPVDKVPKVLTYLKKYRIFLPSEK